MATAGRAKLSNGQTTAQWYIPRKLEVDNHQEGVNCHNDFIVENKDWRKRPGVIRLTFEDVNGLGFDEEQTKFKNIYIYFIE